MRIGNIDSALEVYCPSVLIKMLIRVLSKLRQYQYPNLFTLPSQSLLPPAFPSFRSFSSRPSKPLSDPSYDPILDSPFSVGQSPPFSFLSQALDQVSASSGPSSKALQKLILANLFRSVLVLKPEDLVKTYYLCIGSLAPEYRGVETRLGKDIIAKVLAKELNISETDLKQAEKQKGDLGEVFFTLRKPIPSANLTISDVYDAFISIATVKGNASVAQKDLLFQQLLSKSHSFEGKYIVRMAQKGLKIGCSQLTMESALARAVALTPPQQGQFPPLILASPTFEQDIKEVERVIKRAANECPDMDVVLNALLQYGPAGKSISFIEEMCSIRPGVPVLPMLASPAKGTEEVRKRMKGEVTCEYKYDGTRAQIHILPDKSVRIFSRNSEEMTGMYPDLVALMKENIGVQDCIVDCEVVAVDVSTGKILPFQALQHRRRIDVDISEVKISVCIFLFDLMYLNGKSTMALPLSQRRILLSANIPSIPMRRQLVTYRNLSADGAIEALVEEAVSAGCEGLMVKSLEADYQPAKRSFSWLKLKKDYMQGVTGDSLDLVPIGACYGNVIPTQGKRTGVYGSFLLAVFDPSSGNFQSICRLGTGFKDSFLQEAFAALQPHSIPSPQTNYQTPTADIDVWFSPSCVWEVKAADFSLSPEHQAAIGTVAAKKGIALRFPRFLRVRADKKPQQATSSEAVLELFRAQNSRVKAPK